MTGKAIRILGYVEISESTAGTWATGPTYVQLFGPGVKKPGDVIQTVNSGPITTQTILGGSQTQTGVSAAISSTSAANIIRIRASVNVEITAAYQAAVRISRGTGPTLIGTNVYVQGGNSNSWQQPLVNASDTPNTTSSTTYYIFGICSIGNNCAVNYNVGPFSPPASDMILEEIMSSLEPANDNVSLRMVG